jgi:solute carrier family 35 protein
MIGEPLRRSLYAAVFYGVCSGSMNFLNKLVLSSWHFPSPNFLMLCQMIVLSIGIDLLKHFGYSNAVDYTWDHGKSCIVLSFFFAVNTVIALFALNGMNIPMYNAMRRCVPIANLLLGVLFLRARPSRGIVISVLTITSGTLVAAFGDINFDAHAYTFGVISVISNAAYLTTLQKTGMEKNIGAISIAYINSINCMPVMTLVLLLSGDINKIASYPYWSSGSFLFSFLSVVFSGCIFTYSMFLCTTVNSALTTSCVSVLKSAVTTWIGMYTFGGVTPTTFFLLGQTINFTGGVMYTLVKYRANQRKKLNPLIKQTTP